MKESEKKDLALASEECLDRDSEKWERADDPDW